MSYISETLEYEGDLHEAENAKALYEALWQILDDMSEDGNACCQAAKEQGLNALRAAQGQSTIHFDWMDH